MKQTRINIRALVNKAQIRRERRSGRDVIVVPSVTLPDNVVMNGIRYQPEEIARSYMGLNNTPAPLGHPYIDGQFLSASDPRAVPRNSIGAWNENVRRENGRVYVDKVIDVEFAKQLEGGRNVLNAIEAGDPIHTSTGLYSILRPVKGVEGVTADATDIVFDHDAILLGEDGAATPEQGVGMLVNKAQAPDGQYVDVVNSALADAQEELDEAIDCAIQAAAKVERVPLIDRIRSVIMDTIRGSQSASIIQTESEMTVTQEQYDTLVQQVKDMQASIPATVANAVAEAVKPLVDAQLAIANAAKATADAELAGLRTQIVASHVMGEDAAGELTLNAARALVANAKPRPAAALSNRMVDHSAAPTFAVPD